MLHIALDFGDDVCTIPIQVTGEDEVRVEPPATPVETRRDIPCTEHSYSDAHFHNPSELAVRMLIIIVFSGSTPQVCRDS